MSSYRYRRVFRKTDGAILLQAIGIYRRASLDAGAAALINRKDIAKGCDALRKSIDDLAEILTGDREHFWVKMHSSPPTGLPDH